MPSRSLVVTLVAVIRESDLTCALCRRRGDASFLHAQRSICRACVPTVVSVVNDEKWRERLWRVVPSEHPPADQVSPAPQQWATEFWDKISREWCAIPLESIEPSAETHVDLAVAYREVGLLDDALTEAAAALASPDLVDARASEAIRLLFEAKVLRLSIDETLSTIRTEYFPN